MKTEPFKGYEAIFPRFSEDLKQTTGTPEARAHPPPTRPRSGAE